MAHPEKWTFDWFYRRQTMDKADNRFYRAAEWTKNMAAVEATHGDQDCSVGPAAKTSAQRQADLKARRIAAGLVSLKNVWVNPQDVAEMRKHAAKLARRREASYPTPEPDKRAGGAVPGLGGASPQ